MKRGLLSLALVLLTTFLLEAQAQQRYEFTAQQAVEYARKNNVQVKNALIGVQIQEQTNREVTAAAYPSIGSTFTAIDYLSIPTNLLPGELAGQPAGTYIPVKFGTKFNQSAGVNLQQLLFEGQVFVGLQARVATMDFARKNVEVTEENIRANIYKIYYQLAASTYQLAILQTNIDRVQRLAFETKKYYENGFAEKLDINKLEVQLANLQTEKIKAQNTIDNGYLGLKLLMGMPMTDTLVLTEAITEKEIRDGVLDATAYSVKDRKEYQYAQIGVKLNEYNIRRYRLSRYPTVALSSAFNTNRQANKFGFGGQWFNTAYVALNINVPIFSGFAVDARIRRAQLELEQNLNNLEFLTQNIDQEVRVAINTYSNAINTLDFQKRNMTLAEEVYNQTRRKFQEGVGSSTEITSAQSDLLVAQNNYILAMYDAIRAKIDFLKATGKLK
jgi:outer membrane protein